MTLKFTGGITTTGQLTANPQFSSAIILVTDSLEVFLDATDTDSYPGSGTTWTDLQGTSNFTSSGSVTFNGAAPEHFTFDSNGARWTRSSGNENWNNAIHGGSGAATYEYWLDSDVASWNSRQSTGFTYMFSNGNEGGDRGTNINFHTTTKLRLITGKQGSSQFTHITTTTVPTGMHQLVIAVDTTGGTVAGTIYLDGEIFETMSGSFTGQPGTPTDAAILGTGGDGNHTFNGKLHMFRAYSKRLDDAEVLQNYDANKEEFGLS